MSQILLSILIPTVAGREETLDRFMVKHFGNDVSEFVYGDYVITGDEIEVIISKDEKQITIGEKREQLYSKASGLYSWMIDDDDDICDNAIQIILEAIKSNTDVDCITFEEYCLMNGVEYRSNHELKYDDWCDSFDGYDFCRTPFYKDVIKTSIAQSVPFEKIRYAEDHAWSRALKPHLKTEIHIPKQLYRYIHNSKQEDFNSRYGIQ